jgi:hypothetical protein
MTSKTSLSRSMLRRLEVNRDTDTNVDIYVNKDTRPLPPSRRTYGPWHFVGLWMITGSFNVGGWTTGSSLISLGLNVWVCFEQCCLKDQHIDLSYTAIYARHCHSTYLCRLHLCLRRSSWCQMAHRIPAMDEAKLGYLGLSLTNG